MEQPAALAITEQVPKEVVLAGRAAATELTAIVSSREKKLILGDKQYLFFEDWQTIGKFYGVTAKIISTEELKEDDKLVGFLAHAVAVVQDHEISAADGECTRDEANWREKPRFQLRSMAQTRACAKALRNCLGWVAVLADYEPTPAEELDGQPVDKTQHWCELHQTNFFKRGKMKSYAHPIGDTSEWCHEHIKPSSEATKSKSSPIKEASNSNLPQTITLTEPEVKKPQREPDTIETINDLYKACNKDFGLQPAQVIAELGFSSQSDINDTPAECYRKIAAVRE